MANSSPVKSAASFLFRLIRVVIVLAVAGAGAQWLYANRTVPDKKPIEKTPPNVRVIAATPGTQIMTVEAFGTVKPRKIVKIAAEVPGRIDLLHAAYVEGGFIRKGDLLIRIDQRSYRLDRQAALVRIRQAGVDIQSLEQDIRNLEQDIGLSRANVALTQKELDRVKALNESQFASRNSLDKAEQQHLNARIQLQNIENRLRLTGPMMDQRKTALSMARVDFQKADLALEKTEIRSDFNGYVLEKQAEIGEYVNPGQTLGSLYEQSALDVDVRIPLEKMKWIDKFFANGKTPDAQVRVANFEGLDDVVWPASVARIKAKIDERTRTLPMTLEIGDVDRVRIKNVFQLKPGTFVNCRIIGENHDNIFEVPRHLLKSGDRLFLAVDGRLEIRQVNVLRKFEDSVFIDTGLDPGDAIISSPLPGAVEGMALTVRENSTIAQGERS